MSFLVSQLSCCGLDVFFFIELLLFVFLFAFVFWYVCSLLDYIYYIFFLDMSPGCSISYSIRNTVAGMCTELSLL